jgi:hypothetical protein
MASRYHAAACRRSGLLKRYLPVLTTLPVMTIKRASLSASTGPTDRQIGVNTR